MAAMDVAAPIVSSMDVCGRIGNPVATVAITVLSPNRTNATVFVDRFVTMASIGVPAVGISTRLDIKLAVNPASPVGPNPDSAMF